jgi:hypothetical protein
MRSALRFTLVPVVACVAASGIPGSALGQTANYSSQQAVQGKPLQLNVHASGNKVTCAPAALPIIKVIEPPTSGTLTVRQGEMTTNKLGNCDRVKLPAQILFYTARSDFVGRDHLVYGLSSANGQAEVFDITIEVKEATPSEKKPDGDKV